MILVFFFELTLHVRVVSVVVGQFLVIFQLEIPKSAHKKLLFRTQNLGRHPVAEIDVFIRGVLVKSEARLKITQFFCIIRFLLHEGK